MTVAMRWLIIGIISVLTVIGGYQYWSARQIEAAQQASVLYDALLNAVREQQVVKAEALEQTLVKEYPKSPYAVLGAFSVAHLVPEKTISYLESAVSIGAKGPLIHIARVRLAKALGAQQKVQEGLTLLNSVTPPQSYLRLYEEAKGDLYLQDNQPEKAKAAYALALGANQAGIPTAWLELKQADLSAHDAKNEPKEGS
jgi:predicted negative regulator of RcsB-dependent stress response